MCSVYVSEPLKVDLILLVAIPEFLHQKLCEGFDWLSGSISLLQKS